MPVPQRKPGIRSSQLPVYRQVLRWAPGMEDDKMTVVHPPGPLHPRGKDAWTKA